MLSSIADIRTDYKLQTLNEADVAANPFQQFTKWWNQAIQSKVAEVNAFTLATASKAGKPSARIVLLKGYDENGFVFFTNYNSHKGQELIENPFAAIVFFWNELERQIRIEGMVEKISQQESEEYFHSRPAGSQIGAWASPQSTVIPNREILEQNETEYKNKFGENIPKPPHWGGFIIKPVLFEFWQGRSSRLHDRIQYTPQNNNWKIERLAP
ncbi:MAG: pyridoxamine 5'-phosphate oxidase [Bacteroidetes bacterium]|nr:pyridoxamine 5'-phosphate oxidase [Bacteroidota bacterium]MBS1592390.1 pyridoxamine 5'-phosphate oxidase [Bacteroidota bacterium]